MIKKIFLLSIIILFQSNIYAQQDSINVYQVQYDRTLTVESTQNTLHGVYELTTFIEFEKSFFQRKNAYQNNNKLVVDDDDDTVFINTPSEKNVSVVYKDYDKNCFYNKHEIAYKYFVVKDSLNIYNWTILSDSKEILGFKCQLATMSFRGRQYEAWFTTELPVGGPWKYDGLPGMILEIKSLDNFIAFKAFNVKNAKIKLETIENPLNTKKVLTWEEFKALYKKKAIELISYKPNENAVGVESSRGGIENYIDEDDEEYNKALKKIHKSQQ
ncbi:GLPGLI family protein [Mesoflavibacter sp. CH_XMU1422-2]|uniref:GLPGLI family protein n=1 Tax=Mesoflavibacter sp. CH_XMU1422-2 TaxID=3107770 RepID=UPI00300A9A8B